MKKLVNMKMNFKGFKFVGYTDQQNAFEVLRVKSLIKNNGYFAAVNYIRSLSKNGCYNIDAYDMSDWLSDKEEIKFKRKMLKNKKMYSKLHDIVKKELLSDENYMWFLSCVTDYEEGETIEGVLDANIYCELLKWELASYNYFNPELFERVYCMTFPKKCVKDFIEYMKL